MKIIFKLHATLRDYLPAEATHHRTRIEIEVPEGTTVQQVIDRYDMPTNLVHLVLVDGVYLAKEARLVRVLQPGEALAIWPPVAGG